MSAFMVTPSSVPPAVVKIISAPALVVTVPPTIFPRRMNQLPVVASSVSPDVFVRVPVRFTVPPVRLIVPRFGGVKLPPRLTVPPASSIVPVFAQLPANVRVAPLEARSVPVLVQFEAATVRVPPPSESISPSLVRLPPPAAIWPFFPCTVTVEAKRRVVPPAAHRKPALPPVKSTSALPSSNCSPLP